MALIHYHAGWNMPGYLPEMDPGTFETEAEGQSFIEWEQESVLDDDDQYIDGGSDPYVYWVEPCYEEECAPSIT